MNRAAILLFASTVLLSLLGIFILYETSPYTALLSIGDKYFFVKYQILWVTLGIISALFVSRIPYKRLYPLALPLLVVTILLLIAVFFPGVGLKLKGAHRWVNLGATVLQPSELLKISLTLYLAAWLSGKERKRLLAFLLLFALCVALVALEPDMGTAAIIAATSVVVYFLSGSALRETVAILLIFLVGGFFLVKLAPYRAARLANFSDFNKRNLSGTSYHVKQILISLGSGGLTGVGFGRSIQKYAYLPEGTTDSIFALFAEEAGFLGSLFLIALYAAQLFLGFFIARGTQDKFGKLLAVGITSFIGIQTLANLSSQVVLIPLTGVPLPFISYGGSSMIINYVSIGILLNIARKK